MSKTPCCGHEGGTGLSGLLAWSDDDAAVICRVCGVVYTPESETQAVNTDTKMQLVELTKRREADNRSYCALADELFRVENERARIHGILQRALQEYGGPDVL